jgi:hypothetical protein
MLGIEIIVIFLLCVLVKLLVKRWMGGGRVICLFIQYLENRRGLENPYISCFKGTAFRICDCRTEAERKK